MHFKQLDSLRAIAVMMVVLYRWLPNISLFQTLHLGSLGVSMFFVLSGFLITRILMEEKDKIETKKQSLGKAFKLFYIRRSIRIFPIYYVLLAFLFALNFESVRSEIVWHLFYASNILFVLNNKFSNGLSHLWSLCVEEQFYLLWPILIFIVPQRFLKQFFLFTIVVGISAQFILGHFFPLGGLLMVAKVDAFGWGGLLAYLFKNNNVLFSRLGKKHLLQVGLWALFLIFHLLIKTELSICVFHCLCFFIVNHFVVGFTGYTKTIVENNKLLYLGKISYGIYLYHNLMQWLLPYFGKVTHLGFPENVYIKFIVYLIFTLIVASLSWVIIEKPFNKLKNKFSYQ